MTLDEAIRYEETIVEEYDKIASIKAVTLGECERVKKHIQLANWLKELKQLREQESSKDELKDLSKRVENIERQIKEDKEEQLKKLKAELEYAKFCCALPTIQRMMGGEE